MNPKPITNGNMIYCCKHEDWFFSRLLAEKNTYPKMCPICHRRDYSKPKK